MRPRARNSLNPIVPRMYGGNLRPLAPRNDMPSSVFRSLAQGTLTTHSVGKDDRSSRPGRQDCLQRSLTCGYGQSQDLTGVWHGFRIRVGSMLWITGLRHDLLLAKIVSPNCLPALALVAASGACPPVTVTDPRSPSDRARNGHATGAFKTGSGFYFVRLPVWASHSGLVSAYSASPCPAPSMTSASGPRWGTVCTRVKPHFSSTRRDAALATITCANTR